MKSLTILLWVALLSATSVVFAQTREIGVSGGTSNFLGDLGKKEPNGKFYFGDIEASLFRPAVGVFYRHGFNKWVAVKAALNYGRFEGDDRLTDYKEVHDDAWFRNYRNLHFKSRVIEASFTCEVHLLPYAAGSTKWRIAPYVMGGIGIFNFDPKAEYHGEWVRLRPLGTEGQGMPGYGNKYALIQPSFPVGIGLKYNITRELTVSFEFGHRFTLTDYIDDVSTVYPDKNDLFSYYGQQRAQMIYELSRRSPEKDPEGRYARITESGQQRGNPGGKDNYLLSMVSISYVLGKSYYREDNPFGIKKYQKYKRVFFDR
jgi:opacity protein-like surface antigen